MAGANLKNALMVFVFMCVCQVPQEGIRPPTTAGAGNVRLNHLNFNIQKFKSRKS
jgi:hypothetical protein